MKRFFALFLAAALALSAQIALAGGNATIAVQGRDGFDDYISSMFVWDGRLLMNTYDTIYTWSPEDGLAKVEGYEELRDIEIVEEDGERYAVLGEEEFDLEEEEYLYFTDNILAMGDRVFKQAILSGEDGVVATLLVELVIGEDGSFSLGETIDMGDALLEDWGDGYTGYTNIEASCFTDGVLYGIVWGGSGRELLTIDLENDDVDRVQMDEDGGVSGIAPFDEGRLLMMVNRWEDDGYVTNLVLYDVQEEESAPLGEIPTVGYNTPAALCYDEARALLYYVQAGSVWRVPVAEDSIGTPEEFGDMPLEVYSDTAAVLLGDLYIISSYQGVVGRDVTVEELPQEHLVISNGSYVEAVRSAYFDFTAVHPEYLVSIQNGGYDADTVIQAMMSRDSGVDIYTLSCESPLFGRLMTRGYMAELGESETLTNYVGEMYPFLQELAQEGGELYAVPMEMYAQTVQLNAKLLTEKFGYAEDELPTNWVALFELIADLADGKMEDVPEASLYYPGWTRDDVAHNLFFNMIDDYFLWLDADEAHLSRAGDVLLSLCEAFDAIDWEGLGLPEEYEDDGMWDYSEENMIFDMTSLGVYVYRRDGEGAQVWPLAIAEGEETMVSATVGLAFVNPFSAHREAAIEYLEMASKLVENRTLTMMIPTKNDPVESKYYEENLKSYQDIMEDIEKRIAEAEEKEDDETVQTLQESLENVREGYEWMQEYGRWEISPEGIERYRKHAGLLRAARSSLWQSDDAYTQVYQYLDGAISAQQLVSELEKTLTMQREEGV